MIKATCRTNLDGYTSVEWPREFAALPRIGDRVEGVRGTNERPTLKVVGVTHTMGRASYNGPMVPMIEVELNRG